MPDSPTLSDRDFERARTAVLYGLVAEGSGGTTWVSTGEALEYAADMVYYAINLRERLAATERLVRKLKDAMVIDGSALTGGDWSLFAHILADTPEEP